MEAIKKYVIEIRFKPYSPILDKLGRTVFKLLDSEIIHWEVNGNKNRLDVWNKDRDFDYFLTYFSFGARFEDVKYLEKFETLTKTLLEEFPNLIFTRFGFKATFLYKTDTTFESLKNKFKSELVTENVVKYLPDGVELNDYSFSTLVKHKHNSVNITSGPMEEPQSKEIFILEETYPVGLFIDTDYYKKKHLPLDKQLKSIKTFLDEGESFSKEVRSKFLNNILSEGEVSNGK